MLNIYKEMVNSQCNYIMPNIKKNTDNTKSL